jgi:cytoskeletal protein RodZ
MARSLARSASGNKRLAVIGAVGAVAVLGLLVFALTRGGGSSSSSPPTTAPSSRTVSERALATGRRAQTTPSTTTTTTPVESMPDSFETFTERNPFQPAVGVSTGATTPNTGATTVTTAPSSGTTNGTVTGGTATTETTTPPSQNPSSGTVVQLLEVVPVNGQQSARVQVASTVYTVAPGQTFATSYKLVSLSGSCGQFLFGDSPFQLCTGQQVLK